MSSGGGIGVSDPPAPLPDPGAKPAADARRGARRVGGDKEATRVEPSSYRVPPTETRQVSDNRPVVSSAPIRTAPPASTATQPASSSQQALRRPSSTSESQQTNLQHQYQYQPQPQPRPAAVLPQQQHPHPITPVSSPMDDGLTPAQRIYQQRQGRTDNLQQALYGGGAISLPSPIPSERGTSPNPYNYNDNYFHQQQQQQKQQQDPTINAAATNYAPQAHFDYPSPTTTNAPVAQHQQYQDYRSNSDPYTTNGTVAPPPTTSHHRSSSGNAFGNTTAGVEYPHQQQQQQRHDVVDSFASQARPAVNKHQQCVAGIHCQHRASLQVEVSRSVRLVAANDTLLETQEYLSQKCQGLTDELARVRVEVSELSREKFRLSQLVGSASGSFSPPGASKVSDKELMEAFSGGSPGSKLLEKWKEDVARNERGAASANNGARHVIESLEADLNQSMKDRRLLLTQVHVMQTTLEQLTDMNERLMRYLSTKDPAAHAHFLEEQRAALRAAGSGIPPDTTNRRSLSSERGQTGQDAPRQPSTSSTPWGQATGGGGGGGGAAKAPANQNTLMSTDDPEYTRGGHRGWDTSVKAEPVEVKTPPSPPSMAPLAPTADHSPNRGSYLVGERSPSGAGSSVYSSAAQQPKNGLGASSVAAGPAHQEDSVNKYSYSQAIPPTHPLVDQRSPDRTARALPFDTPFPQSLRPSQQQHQQNYPPQQYQNSHQQTSGGSPKSIEKLINGVLTAQTPNHYRLLNGVTPDPNNVSVRRNMTPVRATGAGDESSASSPSRSRRHEDPLGSKARASEGLKLPVESLDIIPEEERPAAIQGILAASGLGKAADGSPIRVRSVEDVPVYSQRGVDTETPGAAPYTHGPGGRSGTPNRTGGGELNPLRGGKSPRREGRPTTPISSTSPAPLPTPTSVTAKKVVPVPGDRDHLKAERLGDATTTVTTERVTFLRIPGREVYLEMLLKDAVGINKRNHDTHPSGALAFIWKRLYEDRRNRRGLEEI